MGLDPARLTSPTPGWSQPGELWIRESGDSSFRFAVNFSVSGMYLAGVSPKLVKLPLCPLCFSSHCFGTLEKNLRVSQHADNWLAQPILLSSSSVLCNESLFWLLLFFFIWHDAFPWYRRLLFGNLQPQNASDLGNGSSWCSSVDFGRVSAAWSGLSRALCTQQDNTYYVSRAMRSPGPSLK